ncbi:MAG: polyprenyl synthetase family protein, partial [Cyclobacteriaceae bacterium]
MIKEFETYTNLINRAIEDLPLDQNPEELYQPIRYILSLGGKRLRPLLALLAYGLFKEDISSIIKPALAVELFHNFTLMHDDIMDQAPLRRGQPTVHEKWNSNIALLSGDIMMVQAYQLLASAPNGQLKSCLDAFSQCAAEVCEGQQIDMNFEQASDVTVEGYLDMIRKKTAALIGFSLELGALLAGANDRSREGLRDFGLNIGLGFQLKDDLLDVYGEQAKFGKQVGGDIIANKKTYLLIKSLSQATPEQKGRLDSWLQAESFNAEEKVKEITAIYDQLNIKETTEKLISQHFDNGYKALEQLSVPEGNKKPLKLFADYL